MMETNLEDRSPRLDHCPITGRISLLKDSPEKEKLLQFRDKLYRKAKCEPNFRFYALWDKMYRYDVLSIAVQLVKLNNGCAGIDGVKVNDIPNVEAYVRTLQTELEQNQCKPSPVMRIEIPKPDGRKRPLGIPTFKDRVIQTAMHLMLEPIYEADFKDFSKGFRPGKNCHQAIEQILESISRGQIKIIDADIEGFYENMDHKICARLLERRIADRRILKLIKLWLRSSTATRTKKGKWHLEPHRKGTAQGGVISPLIANVYLHEMDKVFSEDEITKGGTLSRYADDFVMMFDHKTNKQKLWLNKVMGSLKLNLSKKKTHTIDIRKRWLNFLGFRLKLTEGARVIVEPSMKAMVKIRMDIAAAVTEAGVASNKRTEQLGEILTGWLNYFTHKFNSPNAENQTYIEKIITLAQKEVSLHTTKPLLAGYSYTVNPTRINIPGIPMKKAHGKSGPSKGYI